MKPVRILLLEVPQLLRGILEHAIQRQEGCELMTDQRSTLEMLKAQGASPNIVILGVGAAEDATLVPALFARWPSSQVMTLTHGGEEAVLYALEPTAQKLSRPSPSEIVERLCAAVERPGLDGEP